MIKPRIRFLSKLIIFSSAAHAIVLGLFFFVYQTQQSIAIKLSGVAADVDWATITLVPLAKTIPGSQQQLQKSLPKKTVAASHKSIQTPPKEHVKQQPIKEAQKVQTKSGTQIAQQKPAPKIAKKEIPKKPNLPQKKEIVAQAVQPAQEEKKVLEQHNVVSQQPAQEMIYVGRDDRQQLYLQHELYTQLSKQWQPPVGIPAETECILKALITKDGMVADVITDKTSGILVFDVAARAAIIESSFPQSVWGKEIIITFNQ